MNSIVERLSLFVHRINPAYAPCVPLRIFHIHYLIIFCFLWSSHAASDEVSYRFGVFPYLPVQKVEKLWSPLIAHLSQQLNVKIHLRTRSNYSSFESAIENEDFDIAFMQPFVYTNVASHHNYSPLARFVSISDKEGVGKLAAIFVTLKENKNISISDIKGKVVAMPPSTAAVSILGRQLLLGHGLKAGRDYKISTHANHHSCLRQLIINQPIICVTAHPPYARFNPKNQNRLTILLSTPAIPSSVIAIHKRVPNEVRVRIKQILLNVQNTVLKQEFLNPAKLSHFVESRDTDYDVVRQISRDLIKNKLKL